MSEQSRAGWMGRMKGRTMKKVLVVIDMQNDFIDGSLGTAEACAIVDAVSKKISGYASQAASGSAAVFATRDTHETDYLGTQEGRLLPVEHCIRGTKGWQINEAVAAELEKAGARIIDKPTFGSVDLARELSELNEKEEGGIEVEMIGLCTDICVVSNALLLKAEMPEITISVDPACCAGVTPEKHEAALETMRSCQIIMSDTDTHD